jgi:hypothetical protein
MRSRSMLGTLAVAVCAVVSSATPAAAAPGGGATVDSERGCESFQDPDTGSQITYCVDHRLVSNETVTPAGVTVFTSVLDSSFSFQQNGVVVNTGAERRRATFVVRDGATQVLTFTSDRESFFFGTYCTYEVDLKVIGDRVVIDEADTVCTAL